MSESSSVRLQSASVDPVTRQDGAPSANGIARATPDNLVKAVQNLATGMGQGVQDDKAHSLAMAAQSMQQADQSLFARTLTDAQNGDGNAYVRDVLQAYRTGALTKRQAIDIVSGAQRLANDHGGGIINDAVKDEAKALLGGSYINGGETRAGHVIGQLAGYFTVYGIIKETIDRLSKDDNVDFLATAQSAVQSGVEGAMARMQAQDADLAREFQQAESNGDGNRMVDILVQLKNNAQNDGLDGPFRDSDARLLGNRIGNVGKGKVNTEKDEAFAQAFGKGYLYRGTSRGEKFLGSTKEKLDNIRRQFDSPVTGTVAGIDHVRKGDLTGAVSDFVDVGKGVALNATLFALPGAATGALKAASEAGTLARAGGLTSGKVLDVVTRTGEAASKVKDMFAVVTTPSEARTGRRSKRP
jgi:hypothetical protein